MSEEKPIVATLVMKAGGMARQRIQLSGRKNLDFMYRRGVGHVREYRDIETFHQEEAALREIVRMPFNIRTVLGEIGDQARVKGALKAMIADDSGHRPAKHAKLVELRALLDAEIARLESAGVGREPERSKDEPPSQLSAREMAIERRRAYLRRAGEEHTRNIVRDYGLQVPKLNNYQGMMDAIIEREFPKEEGGSETPVNAGLPTAGEDAAAAVESPGESRAPALESDGAGAAVAGNEPDLVAMPMAELRKFAKDRGVKGQGRGDIIAGLAGLPK